ncbi:hypothetical protein H4V98_004310 [Polaromonas sp. CG_23.6]|nr:hypothetical protein [Polaromonas sp. CG_23.6]
MRDALWAQALRCVLGPLKYDLEFKTRIKGSSGFLILHV